ncbi:DUF58 domain-containing protein, partial [Pseudomonas syringae]|nr:DUF58 domain-containing protein [Pseudomonas syringae]
MKQMLRPTVALLRWLGALTCGALLLGTLHALGIDYPAQLDRLYWGALLVLAIASLLDAFWLVRQASPQVQRHLPGSLALDRWNEARLDLEHHGSRPLTLRVFDHLPHGLEGENLPQSITLPAGEKGQLGYRLRPSSRGHFIFEQCEI